MGSGFCGAVLAHWGYEDAVAEGCTPDLEGLEEGGDFGIGFEGGPWGGGVVGVEVGDIGDWGVVGGWRHGWGRAMAWMFWC